MDTTRRSVRPSTSESGGDTPALDSSPGGTVFADSRRREIVSRAAELFDREGYHTTNMNSVARAAGLQKPTLYYYFSGKSEILNVIHEEFIDILIDKQRSRAKENLPAADQLRAVMGDVLELMDTHHGHVRVFFEHHRELSEADQAAMKIKRDVYQALVEEIVARGIESGAFERVDVRLTTLALFGMCNWTYQWYRQGGQLESREIADFFCDLLLHGFAAQS
jgi:AcrR family transcriptional regulator